jgi:beta-phosphoglucomutase-like phosphatase (HAD superfamily)
VRAIIFDFDGLLMDTESTSFLSWQYEWSQWGLTLQVADTAHGVAAAHAAGMRCIAIPSPFVALGRVRDADLVLSSASQLRLADALSQLS